MNSRRQTGIVGCFSVYEYDAGDVRRHEFTRKEKEDDRTRHIFLFIHVSSIAEVMAFVDDHEVVVAPVDVVQIQAVGTSMFS